MKQKSPNAPPNKLAGRAHIHSRSFPPDLPATAWLTLDEVLQYVPISRSAWFRGMQSGQLPRPQKIGRLAFWKARDIRLLLDMGPRKARKPAPARRPENSPDAKPAAG